MTKQNGGINSLKYQIYFFKKTIREPPLLGAIPESISLAAWRAISGNRGGRKPRPNRAPAQPDSRAPTARPRLADHE